MFHVQLPEWADLEQHFHGAWPVGYKDSKGRYTMHNLIFIRRRFPKSANRIILVLSLLSASTAAIGLGLLFLG